MCVYVYVYKAEKRLTQLLWNNFIMYNKKWYKKCEM